MIIAMQRLDKCPAICAGSHTTSVYGSLLGNGRQANGLPW
jgi:hypothetical protein